MDAWLANICQMKNVEIVEDYDQSEDPAAQADELTEGGWCLGVVIDWLRCKRNSMDFWDSFRSGSGKNRVRFIMARQAIIKAKGSGSDVAGKMKEGMKAAGMSERSSNARLNIGQVSAADLYHALAATQGRYITVVIGGAGGSHALGILISQTQLVFLDPNAGEFAFPTKATFREWLPIFLTGMGYSGQGLLSSFQMDSFG